jgi:hypothetical protein
MKTKKRVALRLAAKPGERIAGRHRQSNKDIKIPLCDSSGRLAVEIRQLMDKDEVSQPAIRSLGKLAEAEQACRRCPLYRDTTQAVPGEGAKAAGIMLVGEQPGDKEDIAGQALRRPRRQSARSRAQGRGHRARRDIRHQRGQALQTRNARQTPAAQAAEQLRDRAV